MEFFSVQVTTKLYLFGSKALLPSLTFGIDIDMLSRFCKNKVLLFVSVFTLQVYMTVSFTLLAKPEFRDIRYFKRFFERFCKSVALKFTSIYRKLELVAMIPGPYNLCGLLC